MKSDVSYAAGGLAGALHVARVAAAHPPDPAPDEEASVRIAFLIDESAALSLPLRVERAFVLTLRAAGDALRQGQLSQPATLFNTFAFEVRGAKRAKRLSAETADALIARAEKTSSGP